MKKFVKFLSICLSLILLVPLTPVKAVGENKDSLDNEYKISVVKNKKNPIEGKTNFSDLIIGEQIPIYKWDGKNLIEDQSASRHPVYEDGKIIAFYTVIDPLNDGEAYQFGEEYARELNDFLEGTDKKYCLIGSEGKVFALSANKIEMLVDYGDMRIDPQRLKLQIEAMPEGQNKKEALKFYRRVERKNTAKESYKQYKDSDLLISEIQKYWIDHASIISMNDDLTSTFVKKETNIQNKMFSRAGNYRFFNVEIYNQLPDQNICWAVAATRIGNYWTKKSISPREAVRYIFNVNSHIGTIFDAQNVIDNMYNLPSTYTYSGFSWSEVKNKIEGGYMYYGAFYNTNLTGGHAVCINGYYIDGSHDILVMESLGGRYQRLHSDSQGRYVMSYTGMGNLYWDASLTV